MRDVPFGNVPELAGECYPSSDASAECLDLVVQVCAGTDPACLAMRRWRNGKLDGLKSHCPKGLVGSNPTRRITGIEKGMRTAQEVAEVKALAARGLNQCEIARATGRKHERPIVLADWQYAIVEQHPKCLIRGLIHSDGCRVLNKSMSHVYPRYFFDNASGDIRGIFCDACDRRGIAWRHPKERTISIARRESIALLDTFVGPKT
jgi:hypothetical protein